MDPNKDNMRNTKIIIFLCVSLFALYIAWHIIMAFDYLQGDEQNLLSAIPLGLEHMDNYPLELRITPHFISGMGYCLMVVAIVFLNVFFIKRKTRFGREHGTAMWATKEERKKIADKDFFKNMILSNDLFMSLNTRLTRRNNSQTVVGGSGSGKTRFVAKPNILQMNCSYVITDPKADLVKSCGQMLKDAGYEVRLFNLLEPTHSDCYNPFAYIHTEADIFKIANQFINSTKDKSQQNSSADPFWDKAEQAWYSATFSLIWMEFPKEQQNFKSVMKLLNISGASEEDESKESELDIIFRKLEEEKGADYFPCKQYRIYKLAPGKTAKSILISAGVRLAPFNVKEIMDITVTDTVDLKSIGDKKTVLFIAIPDKDGPYNFLVSLLYTQLFDELYFQADFGETKWNNNKTLYRSKESCLEKKNELKELYDEYQRSREDKRKEKVYHKIQKLCKEIQKEFGIPYQIADGKIKAKYIKEYCDALDTCMIRLKDRRRTLKGYYENYKRNISKIKTLQSSTSRHSAERLEKLVTENKAIEMRLEYEFGIKKQMPKQKRFLFWRKPYTEQDYKSAEKHFRKDIEFLIRELGNNPNYYGTRQSLDDKREKINLLLKDIEELNEKIEDTGKRQKDLRKEYQTEIATKRRTIRRIENIAEYEFGIKDLMKKQKNGGRLPVHVRCILDEFANISPVPDFDKLVATMRSREISVTIILQTISQLKAMYEKQHETIIGNCDTMIFLGGQEQSTLEFLVKKLGKETIDKRSQGTSKGRQGSSSENWDTMGTELMTADGIANMNNEDCLVFVRGYHPFYCKKYVLEKHPNYHKMGDPEHDEDPRYFHFEKIYNTEQIAMSLFDVQIGIDDEFKRMLDEDIEKSIKNMDMERFMGTAVRIEDKNSFVLSNTYTERDIKMKTVEYNENVERMFLKSVRDGSIKSTMVTSEMKKLLIEKAQEEEGRQIEKKPKISSEYLEIYGEDNILYKPDEETQSVHGEQETQEAVEEYTDVMENDSSNEMDSEEGVHREQDEQAEGGVKNEDIDDGYSPDEDEGY